MGLLNPRAGLSRSPGASPRPAGRRSPSSGRSASRRPSSRRRSPMIPKPMIPKSRSPTKSQMPPCRPSRSPTMLRTSMPPISEGDEDRHERDVQVVVELPDRLDVRPAVGAEHQDPVGRVDERHPGREQGRQDQDEEDRHVVRAGRGGEARGARPRWRCRSPGRTGRRAGTCASSCGSTRSIGPEHPGQQAAVVEEVLERLLVVAAAARTRAGTSGRCRSARRRLMIPMTSRNVGRDRGPDEAADLPEGRDVADDAGAEMAIRTDRATTIVEWPSEKKSPTPTGRWPSCISLRVVLSIAAMWSASTAWRRPNV